MAKHNPIPGLCDGACQHPGKYEGNDCQEIASKLHEMSLDGCDEEHGAIDECGHWFGLLANVTLPGLPEASFIVCEDSQGFFGYVDYDTVAEARAVFERGCQDCATKTEE